MTCWVSLVRVSPPHQVNRRVTSPFADDPLLPPESPPHALAVSKVVAIATAASARRRPPAVGGMSGLMMCAPFRDYLMPVVAMPLIRNRWPSRKARKIGTSETTDIANIDPQEDSAVASTNDRSATGTVYIFGSVR